MVPGKKRLFEKNDERKVVSRVQVRVLYKDPHFLCFSISTALLSYDCTESYLWQRTFWFHVWTSFYDFLILHSVSRLSLIYCALRKHAYSNKLKNSPPKTGNFQIKKKSDIFHIPAQNIDCGYSLEPLRRGGSNEYSQSMFWGGSNEYPQSMFWAEIRKIMYIPINPSFTI